ncbi:MAG: ABC transporter ATP-binding protein [Gemmatimonadetes bacterium]|jgi:ABC-2 type transport system ATP-binding protein|nr:ABC transporter ATP-binding protein [Gemmatimonadota bacterium]
MTALAIRTESLTCDFETVRAVDDLSLEVPAGSVFGFLGPNGSGKTTTIRLLLGVLEPTAGRAEVLGFDSRTQGDRIRERAGALLEHPGIYERLSAEDNLEFYGRVWRMPAAERRARIRELLSHFGLWDRRGELAGKWSRGMKQKLAVARALLHRPSLVFLDEPTAGLDPVAAVSLREDIGALAAREGATVFLTTHNLAEAERVCDLVGVIRGGRLLAVGPPRELHSRAREPGLEVVGRSFGEELIGRLGAHPEVAAVRRADGRLLIDLRGDASAAPLIALIVHAGGEIEEVHRSRASLEDVFLSLMEEA